MICHSETGPTQNNLWKNRPVKQKSPCCLRSLFSVYWHSCHELPPSDMALICSMVLLDSINKAAESWGVDCKRYEIRKWTELHWVCKLALSLIMKLTLQSFSLKFVICTTDCDWDRNALRLLWGYSAGGLSVVDWCYFLTVFGTCRVPVPSLNSRPALKSPWISENWKRPWIVLEKEWKALKSLEFVYHESFNKTWWLCELP